MVWQCAKHFEASIYTKDRQPNWKFLYNFQVIQVHTVLLCVAIVYYKLYMGRATIYTNELPWYV